MHPPPLSHESQSCCLWTYFQFFTLLTQLHKSGGFTFKEEMLKSKNSSQSRYIWTITHSVKEAGRGGGKVGFTSRKLWMQSYLAVLLKSMCFCHEVINLLFGTTIHYPVILFNWKTKFKSCRWPSMCYGCSLFGSCVFLMYDVVSAKVRKQNGGQRELTQCFLYICNGKSNFVDLFGNNVDLNRHKWDIWHIVYLIRTPLSKWFALFRNKSWNEPTNMFPTLFFLGGGGGFEQLTHLSLK